MLKLAVHLPSIKKTDIEADIAERRKAPERACMKLELWPSQDRMLWQAALMLVDPRFLSR
jgi:hypothetical protein